MPAGGVRLMGRLWVTAMASLVFFLAAGDLSGQPAARGIGHRHQLETYPIMAFFKVYSLQYAYRLSEKNELILGLAYVNVEVSDRSEVVIGQLNAPTLPIGIRRYLWGRSHIEYQLWPAYNFYYDRIGERYYNGFDLYNEIRLGYRLDFTVRGAPLFTNLQYVYGAGLYPGNKPDNFHQAVDDAPPFHVPSISIGVRF